MNLKLFVSIIFIFIIQQTFAYQTYSFAQLCPTSDSLTKSFNLLFRNMKEVHLFENEQSGALISYSWNSSNFKKYSDCRFRVVATINDNKVRNRGLFVSIRRLNLRKARNSDSCTDFIQFTFGEKKTPKFCGQLNASFDDVEKIFFGESGGTIEVYLNFEKQIPLQNIDDTLDVELVFTANENCIIGAPDLIKCYDNTCISKSFENDGINNCPPPFCDDEGGKCPNPPVVQTRDRDKEPVSNNTDIVISALTSLIFTLVGVGSCLWLCWHIKDCFLPDNESQRSSTNHSSSRRLNNTRSTAFNSPNDSTALEIPNSSNYNSATAPPLEDKDDNPPAYDTLFPQRTNDNQ